MVGFKRFVWIPVLAAVVARFYLFPLPEHLENASAADWALALFHVIAGTAFGVSLGHFRNGFRKAKH